MLDDLKKDRHIGFGAQERLKLSLYVAGMLVLGGVIFVGTRTGGSDEQDKPTVAKSAPAAPGIDLGPLLDAADVVRLADADDAAPDGWCSRAFQHVLDIQRRGRLGQVEGARRSVSDMNALATEPRGRVFEVQGKVTEVAGEAWKPTEDATGNERLWTVVLEDAGEVPLLAVKYGNRSDVGEGRPIDAKPAGLRGETIEAGQHVVVRGVYIQERTGSFGGTAVTKAAPVLLVHKVRIIVPPEDRRDVIPELSEALWGDIEDRFNRESRKWDEDALYEVIQWARAQGQEKLRERMLKGEFKWKSWGRDRFDAWKKEVAVSEGASRPITDGSRGKVFRWSGIIGEVLDYPWEQIPRNAFGVDEIQGISLLSDHYRNVSLRVFLPFPVDSFEGVTGKRSEHLRVYGVFIKNFTYDTKHKRPDGSGRVQPMTAPMLVVLHVERYPDHEASQRIRGAMLWVAGAMVIFGLLFYIVLIRGGAKQAKRMEEHRLALRQRIRAKGQGAQLPTSRDAIPQDGAPREDGSPRDGPAADG